MVLKLTLREAADICHINLRTAFLWRHRFLSAQAGGNHDKLSGIIEVDEFFLAYSEKGSNTLINRDKPIKRGGNIDKRTKDGQVTVFLSIDRSNHMINQISAADTTAEIEAKFTDNITENWDQSNLGNKLTRESERSSFVVLNNCTTKNSLTITISNY
jgi:hypothetical protein